MKKTFVMMMVITFGWPMLFRLLVDAGCGTAVASALASAVFIVIHAVHVELTLWKERKKQFSVE
jgi:hypothetical protein